MKEIKKSSVERLGFFKHILLLTFSTAINQLMTQSKNTEKVSQNQFFNYLFIHHVLIVYRDLLDLRII